MSNKKVIKVDISNLDKAINELEKYKKHIQDLSSKFLEALAEEGVKVASVKFSKAVYDGTNDVRVKFEKRGQKKIAVVATGNATLFIEFGTGITYPDNHPENRFERGGYGYRLGRFPTWRYRGEAGTNGEVITEGSHAGDVLTHGNPANMCMYLTEKELEQKFMEIVRRCFND